MRLRHVCALADEIQVAEDKAYSDEYSFDHSFAIYEQVMSLSVSVV